MENEQLSLWRLLDPVIHSLPDQGIEKVSSANAKRKREESDREDEPSPLPRRKPEDLKKKKKTQCLVCGKRHEPLCPLPEGFRKQKRAARKGKSEGKGKPPSTKKVEE